MILVTGAAGTLGSEICRNLVARGESVLALDIAEIDLYRLSLEIPITTIVDSITRPELWKKLRDEYDISTVINCAAVKHVLTVEQHSDWANIVNNEAVGYICEDFAPWKLVHISTDKAVVPSNKYGLTKLRGERRALAWGYGTVVRLVNIHNSRGCAEEIFAKQIAEGGPVTARDKRMARYYTTVEQATKDVIACADHAGPGLFMPDPGEPILIDDIIEHLVGQRNILDINYDKDIEITYTGREKGEKLIEDIMTADESKQAVEWSDRIYQITRGD